MNATTLSKRESGRARRRKSNGAPPLKYGSANGSANATEGLPLIRHISTMQKQQSQAADNNEGANLSTEFRVSGTLSHIFDKDEAFRIDYEVYFRYRLPEDLIPVDWKGVVSVGEDFFGKYRPRVEFYFATCSPLEHIYEIDADTGFAYIGYNWMIDFREQFELQRFPFDTQCLPMAFHMLSNSGHLVPWNDDEPIPEHVTAAPGEDDVAISLAGDDWDLIHIDVKWQSHRCDVTVVTKRRASYYFWNVCIINFFIVLISFSVVEIAVEDLADRMSVTIACFLTCVAFKMVLVENLPVVSYLTLLDKYLLLSFILIGGVTIECTVVCRMEWDDKDAERFIYDAAAIFWVLLHVVIACIGKFNLLTPEIEKLLDQQKTTQSAIGKVRPTARRTTSVHLPPETTETE